MANGQWRREIVELHQFIETYFLGVADSLGRIADVLAPDFSFVGPDSKTTDRAGTLDAMKAGFAHTSSLVIFTRDHRLLIESADFVICEYVEVHELAETSNARRATVIFSPGIDAPNGLIWRRVHETWVDRV